MKCVCQLSCCCCLVAGCELLLRRSAAPPLAAPPRCCPAGLNTCYLVAAACAVLALAVGRASRAAGKGVRGVVGLGVMSLRCNAMMAVLGVAHHTGQVRCRVLGGCLGWFSVPVHVQLWSCFGSLRCSLSSSNFPLALCLAGLLDTADCA